MVQFRINRKTGKIHPITPAHRKYKSLKPGRTLFSGKVKSKRYSTIISIQSPEKARESCGQMREEFIHAKSRKEKVHIMRSVDLAGKRAKASLNRRKAPLSPKERSEMKEVSNIYENAASLMCLELDETQ